MSLVFTGRESQFAHRFGGPPRHTGTVPRGGRRPLNLLYQFDLRDPNIGLADAGIRWLPLYTAIRYDYSTLTYQIVSDGEIRIVENGSLNLTSDPPYEEYPDSFAEFPVSVGEPAAVKYDEELQDLAARLSWPKDPPGELTRNDLAQLAAQVFNPFDATLSRCSCKNRDVNFLAAFHDDWLEDQGVRVWGDFGEYVVMTFWICYSCLTVVAYNCPN